MNWQIKGDRPVYIQLMDQLKYFIISGSLPPGSKLPSVRDMAEDAAVNPNTMQKALAMLDEEGLLLPQSTTGRFITRDLELINRLRQEAAHAEVRALLGEMQALGYAPDEIDAIVTSELDALQNKIKE